MLFSASSNGFFNKDIHGNAIPEDAIEITREEHATLLAAQSVGKRIVADSNGKPIAVDPPPPSLEQIKDGFSKTIQQHLDDFAKTRGYDGILSACTYASSAVPKFQVEGQYCVNARDDSWSSAYAILVDVEAGNRVMPTIEEVMAELPALAWPV